MLPYRTVLKQTSLKSVPLYNNSFNNLQLHFQNGRTMLQYAAEYGDVETVRLLFANNADTDKCDHVRSILLHDVCHVSQ